ATQDVAQLGIRDLSLPLEELHAGLTPDIGAERGGKAHAERRQQNGILLHGPPNDGNGAGNAALSSPEKPSLPVTGPLGRDVEARVTWQVGWSLPAHRGRSPAPLGSSARRRPRTRRAPDLPDDRFRGRNAAWSEFFRRPWEPPARAPAARAALARSPHVRA